VVPYLFRDSTGVPFLLIVERSSRPVLSIAYSPVDRDRRRKKYRPDRDEINPVRPAEIHPRGLRPGKKPIKVMRLLTAAQTGPE